MINPKTLPSWTETIHSAVNDHFVTNPRPKLGEPLKIRLRVAKEAPIREAQCRIIRDGAVGGYTMNRIGAGARFQWFELEYTMYEPRLQYQFLLLSDAADTPAVFYTRNGLTTYHPTEDHDFVIDSVDGFDSPTGAPDWVSRAVFYQIFPDRFHRGDPSCDVATGAYSFDGGTPRAMNWKDKPLEYHEGHCLDFFNGDLDGIRQKIPYLQKLGVTALYLNPIFKARTTHRYDCTDYFHVDESLGGDEALIRLTEALHKAGMKIILDVSINHTGTDHSWFPEKQSYYYIDPETGEAACWLGVPTLPQLNYNDPALRRIIWEDPDSLVRHYLKPPFSIDGWRFDVGNMTARRGKDQMGHEIFRAIRRAVKDENPQAYIIGEHWEDSIAYHLGDQWDGAMNYFSCSRPLRRFTGEQDRFIHPMGHAPSAAPRSTGWELAAQINQHITRIPNPLEHGQLNLIDSHDIHRLHNHTAVHSEALYQGLLALQFLLPGTPCIYYGDELAIDGTIETVEGCRYPMPWASMEEEPRRRMCEIYTLLATLKRDEPALQEGAWKILGADRHTFVFARFDQEKAFMAVLNNNPEPSEVQFSAAAAGVCGEMRDLLGGELRITAKDNGLCAVKLGGDQCLLLAGDVEE